MRSFVINKYFLLTNNTLHRVLILIMTKAINTTGRDSCHAFNFLLFKNLSEQSNNYNDSY